MSELVGEAITIWFIAERQVFALDRSVFLDVGEGF